MINSNKMLIKLRSIGKTVADRSIQIKSAAPLVSPNTEDPFNEEDGSSPLPSDIPPITTEIADKVMWALGDEFPGFIRPSMVGGCKRASYFHYTQVPQARQRHEPKMVRTLATGNIYHDIIQKFLGNSLDIYFAPESPVWHEDLAVRGKCDGICITRDLKYKWPIEIKTMALNQFEKLSKPVLDHIWQAHVYAGINFIGYEGPKWIDMIYICKNNQQWKPFRIPYSEETFREICDWVLLIHDYKKRGKPPRFDEKECDPSFCTFVDHCFKLRDKEEGQAGNINVTTKKVFRLAK